MKKLRLWMLTLLLSAAFAFTSYAMEVNISFTDPEAEVGKEFEVVMKIRSDGNKIGSAKLSLSYDPAYLEFANGKYATGGAGNLVITGDPSLGTTEWPYSFTFKALQPGNTSLTIDSSEVYDTSENAGHISHRGSSSITIGGTATAEVSPSGGLSSLKISPGMLTPAFAPEITEYSAEVGENVERIAVSAHAVENDAKVVISGNSDLAMGDNEVVCKVTSADGSNVVEYVIHVTKKEGTVETGGLLRANVNGTDYEVAVSFDETLLPESFTPISFNYKGTEVQAGRKTDNGMLLMYLIASDGSGDLYLYDPDCDSWSPYAQVNVAEKTITIVPLGEDVTIPEGFADTSIELNGKKVHGWIWAADPDQKYCIIYGMNQDGEKDFYRYDMKEKTIQRYFADPIVNEGISEDVYQALEVEKEELQKQFTIQRYMLIGLAVIAGILLITVILLLFLNRRSPERSSRRRDDAYDEEEEDVPRTREYTSVRRQEPEIFSEEERYMRGMENQQEPNEEEMRRSLAREVEKATEKPEVKPASLEIPASSPESDDDDDFETIDL